MIKMKSELLCQMMRQHGYPTYMSNYFITDNMKHVPKVATSSPPLHVLMIVVLTNLRVLVHKGAR